MMENTPVTADEIRHALAENARRSPAESARQKELGELIARNDAIDNAWRHASPHKIRDWWKRKNLDSFARVAVAQAVGSGVMTGRQALVWAIISLGAGFALLLWLG